MGIITKRTEESKSGGNRLTARIKRKGKKRFEKPIILKGKGAKNDRY